MNFRAKISAGKGGGGMENAVQKDIVGGIVFRIGFDDVALMDDVAASGF